LRCKIIFPTLLILNPEPQQRNWGIFFELVVFYTATQGNLLLAIFSKRIFLNGEKMRKRNGQCRGYSHMQGTTGEYFWNCWYFAQPLKRQPYFLLAIGCHRFVLKW